MAGVTLADLLAANQHRSQTPLAAMLGGSYDPAVPGEQDIVERAGLLPIGRTAAGGLHLALPQAFMDLVNAAKLPGDVFTGRTPMRDDRGQVSDDVIKRAFDLAGATTLGAGAMPAAANEMRMGVKAYHGSVEDQEWLSRVISEARKKYKIVGLRTLEDGDFLKPSRVWVDGEPTAKMLAGTSITDVSDIERAMRMHRLGGKVRWGSEGFYSGDNTAILGGQSAKPGADPGEMILKNPHLIEVIRKLTTN